MKRFYIFALVVAMFAACTSNMTDEQTVCIDVATPETLIGTFEDDEMRIQLDNGKTVWTADDLVSVFYLSNANQKWQYQGETGERTGNLKQVEAGKATETMKRVVVVYPYNENYYINTDTYNVKGWLPAEQTYLADSYGLNGNIMISQSEYNQFSLKNVCGWLKLQLTGNGEKVQSISLKGNNGEQVAGEVYINSADATASLAADMGSADDNDNSAGGNLVFENTTLTEVTLNCGDGVTLSAEPTVFYIALPPQEFSRGLTMEVACTDGSTMTKSTEKEVVIARNTIQPMAAIEYEGYVPQSWKEIRYTATEKTIPYETNVFGANVVSNEWNSTTREGIITFDGKVTSIGEVAFYNCTSLTSVIIPDSVTEIGEAAFYNCTSLTSVTIPDSVTEIGEFAFAYCTSQTSINIPDSVTEIGDNAFIICTSLKEVYYNGDLSAWCKIYFGGSYANPMCNGAKLYLNGVELTEVTIPSDITEIKYTFAGCSSLTSVTISDSVTEIGGYAFQYCTSLTSVTIPDSVTEIGYGAFLDCTSLTSVVIPDSVTSIGNSAFYNCISLTSVTIGDSVTEIGYQAFYGCSSLTSVTIPNSVTEIRERTFYNCTSLTSVTIPDSVTEIGYAAFYGCSSLTSVTIPDSVTEIGNQAFYKCTSLTSVTIPDSVTSIGEYAFLNCTSLASVTIPDSVTEIGIGAFGNCTSLTSVTIPDSVTKIGENAFNGCTSLTSVTIPDSVTEIGENAFIGCTSLIAFYGKFASVDNRCLVVNGMLHSFARAGLTEYTVPDSVTSIGSTAFSNCTSLTSVTIGDSVTEIGYKAFSYCTSLTEVYCKPTTPPSVGTDMFNKNASGRKIYVPRASVDAYKAAEYWSEYAAYIEPYDF